MKKKLDKRKKKVLLPDNINVWIQIMNPRVKPNTIGVIISTYNHPEWLKKTLWGYCRQTRMADEIIIADDGSSQETHILIDSFRDQLPIKHVWQEDLGFRKTAILNKALVCATTDYLIFSDQDCIPRADFIATHERYAQKGYFLSGGVFRLPLEMSQNLTRDDVESDRAFRLKWLLNQGLSTTFKCAKLIRNTCFNRLMNTITPCKATWNGCNASGWRTDLLHVNGFNEEMQYSGEDRECGERLINWGIKAKQIRYSAILLHLDHSRPYVNEEAITKNLAIRAITKKNKVIITPFGIRQGGEYQGSN